MTASSAKARSDHESVDPMIGATLGERYLVHERIARGGMGSIYRAVHLELGRSVAVKVLSHNYARDDEAVKRFLREARTASRINHPNIVDVLDLGRLESGEPYLVMELLEGEDLADVIGRNALSVAQTVELLAPIARALDYIHGQGLLHRDVKPANIFLAERESGGGLVPKLLDFGLASLREPEARDRLTREGIVVGTPHYVSPEAAEGLPVDQRTDVYSLALVAFEAITGLLPIDSERPISLLYAKVRKPAPTMSERTGREFPKELERAIGRALSRTPDRRPASAGELIASIAQTIEATLEAAPLAAPITLPKIEPATAPTLPPSEPVSIPVERAGRRALGVIASVAMIALAAWIGVELARERGGVIARELPRPSRETPTPVAPPIASAPPEIEIEAPRVVQAAPEPELRPRPARRETPSTEPPADEANLVVVSENSAAPRPTATLAHDPDGAAQLVRAGNVELLRGHFPRAMQLYRQATYADDDHAPAWRGIGLSAERMDLRPEARHAYRRYLALSPNAPDASSVRARMASLEAEGAL
jgi:eukaryotic-like serine/threonine-protein kinase